MDAFARFGKRPGADIGLLQAGYLFLLTDPADVELFEKHTALQNSMGVDSRMLRAAEAGQLSTLANVEDVLAASFCGRDGHATPDAVVLGYATAARAKGVGIVTQCPVAGIDVDGGAITAVRTDRGVIATSTVICVAGAWSPGIAAMVGVDLPVQPLARPIWYTEPMPDRPETVPMTIDFSTGFYFHTEGPGLLFGMADPDQRPGFDSPMRPDWLGVVGDVVAHRAPALLDVGIAGGWHGYYETTPDHNALIGEATGVSRFIYATGFSGHGFLMGPAVGEIMRDLFLGQTPVVDVSSLTAERFTKADLRAELNIV